MYVAMTASFPGYWGRGETAEEAQSNCRGKAGILYRLHDVYEKPRVDELGHIWADLRPEYPEARLIPLLAEGWEIGPRGKLTRLTDLS